MHNLKMLLSEKKQLDNDLKIAKNYKHIAFFKQKLLRIEQIIRKFGQRYNCVRVTVEYYKNNNEIECKTIYYTDITKEDAVEYTMCFIQLNFKVITCTAIDIPIGKLI